MLLSDSTSQRLVTTGTGSPESVLTRDVGSVYVQSDASPGLAVIWYKATGSGNTGWVQIAVDTDGTLAANSDLKLATQKAVKTYVDAKVAGLSWKQAVRVATTVAGTLASSFENGDTVDGVTLATGDRILVKDQAAGAENGIYTVNASGAPTRATDADSGAEMVQATVFVQEGTTNADTEWTCTTNATITLGSTSLTFAQRGTGGGSTTLTGTGSPESAQTAAVGTFYIQTDAGTASDGVWYKQTGAGNTGWVQVTASSGSGGGVTESLVTKTTTYTAVTGDTTIVCDASGGAFTVTLYTAVGNAGKVIRLKKKGTDTNLVTVDANGSETIDAALTYLLGIPGDEVTLQSDNANWQVVGSARRFSGCKLRKSTGTTISNNSSTTVTFDTEVYDTDGYHEGVTNPTRITIPADGYYRFTVNIRWASNNTALRTFNMQRNATTTELEVHSFPVNGSVTGMNGSITLFCSATDYFILNVYQNSGGNLSLDAVNPMAPGFEVERVG